MLREASARLVDVLSVWWCPPGTGLPSLGSTYHCVHWVTYDTGSAFEGDHVSGLLNEAHRHECECDFQCV